LCGGQLTPQSKRPAVAGDGVEQAIPLPPDTALCEGAIAALAVRPEKLLLSSSLPNRCAIAAKVSSIGYLGGGSIVHLTTEQGSALKADLPGSAAGAFVRRGPGSARRPPENR